MKFDARLLVVDIDGDGSFTMTMVEIITAVQHKLPTKFVVLDNDYPPNQPTVLENKKANNRVEK